MQLKYSEKQLISSTLVDALAPFLSENRILSVNIHVMATPDRTNTTMSMFSIKHFVVREWISATFTTLTSKKSAK